MIKIIFSGIALALAFGIFFVYTQPTFDSIQIKRLEMERYDEALGRAEELQQLKQALLSRYNAFNPADLERLQRLLPDHVDNVRLVLDLDNLAAQHAMALQNVVISAPGNEAGENSVLGAIGSARQKFDSLTLRFSTRATYPLFVQFMESLESSLRVVDLVSLALAPDTSTVTTGEPMYRFDITIRTYWLK